MKIRVKSLLVFLVLACVGAVLWFTVSPRSSEEESTQEFSSNHLQESHEMKTIGVLLYPDFQLLDVFGPLEMFGHFPEKIKVVLIGTHSGGVKSYQGQSVVVDATLENAPHFDILFVPGGPGTRREVQNTTILKWIQEKSASSEMVLSVCSGAALLAEAGVLDGYRATSNKIAFNWVKSHGPNVHWVEKARWVKDGKMMTSSGIAAGIDMALAFINDSYGPEALEYVENVTEYRGAKDPNDDPFSANIYKKFDYADKINEQFSR